MRNLNRILVIVDPTAHVHPCVEKGAQLARRADVDLELFICENSEAFSPGPFATESHVRSAMEHRCAQLESILHGLAEGLRRSHVRVTTDFSLRLPWHVGVLEKIEGCGADLVIKDTHYHGIIRRALFTNSDWHLIRECRVPLLLTKPAPWPAAPLIAAAVDPGHLDDKPAALDVDLLASAREMARVLEGSALAVHAFDPQPLLVSMAPAAAAVGMAATLDTGILDALRSFHRSALARLIDQVPVFAGAVEFVEGAPFVALPEFASNRGVAILVAGAVARSPLRRMMVGSTAERMLDRLPCDILVVKPGEAFAVHPMTTAPECEEVL